MLGGLLSGSSKECDLTECSDHLNSEGIWQYHLHAMPLSGNFRSFNHAAVTANICGRVFSKY